MRLILYFCHPGSIETEEIVREKLETGAGKQEARELAVAFLEIISIRGLTAERLLFETGPASHVFFQCFTCFFQIFSALTSS